MGVLIENRKSLVALYDKPGIQCMDLSYPRTLILVRYTWDTVDVFHLPAPHRGEIPYSQLVWHGWDTVDLHVYYIRVHSPMGGGGGGGEWGSRIPVLCPLIYPDVADLSRHLRGTLRAVDVFPVHTYICKFPNELLRSKRMAVVMTTTEPDLLWE